MSQSSDKFVYQLNNTVKVTNYPVEQSLTIQMTQTARDIWDRNSTDVLARIGNYPVTGQDLKCLQGFGLDILSNLNFVTLIYIQAC